MENERAGTTPGFVTAILSDAPETVREMLLGEGSFSIDLRVMQVARLGLLPKPFIEITMPCGEYRLYNLENLPRKSAHCTCGEALHWFILYRRDHRTLRRLTNG